MNDAPAWLDIIPPQHVAETRRRLVAEAAELGEPLTITAEESGWLDQAMLAWHAEEHPDSVRLRACRILGSQRVAVVLMNTERGQSTPVVVE